MHKSIPKGTYDTLKLKQLFENVLFSKTETWLTLESSVKPFPGTSKILKAFLKITLNVWIVYVVCSCLSLHKGYSSFSHTYCCLRRSLGSSLLRAILFILDSSFHTPWLLSFKLNVESEADGLGVKSSMHCKECSFLGISGLLSPSLAGLQYQPSIRELAGQLFGTSQCYMYPLLRWIIESLYYYFLGHNLMTL